MQRDCTDHEQLLQTLRRLHEVGHRTTPSHYPYLDFSSNIRGFFEEVN